MTPSGRPLPAYRKTAAFYDAIYSWKDYAKEAREIEKLVRRFGRPGSRTLLDVACGTGNHMVHLRRRFEVTGVDPNPGMLRVARRKLPATRLVRGRMEALDLGRTFDVVTCLFSAIGYLRSERELRRTLRGFAEHLRPGGIVIVEPWLRPSEYRVGGFHARILGAPDRPILRISRSRRRGHRSLMDMHHLVATDGGVRYWVEHHDLGMFTKSQYLAAFRAAGLRPRYRRGWDPHRGLYVGVRPVGRGPTRGSSSARRRRGIRGLGGSRRRTASSGSGRIGRRRPRPFRRS
jgi:ubiquinone/menaquinone biosynthesis C-methylase UbiE